MKRTRSEVVVVVIVDDDDVNDRRKLVVPKKPKTEWEKEKSEKELKMIYEKKKRRIDKEWRQKLLAKREQEIEARKVDLSMLFFFEINMKFLLN